MEWHSKGPWFNPRQPQHCPPGFWPVSFPPWGWFLSWVVSPAWVSSCGCFLFLLPRAAGSCRPQCDWSGLLSGCVSLACVLRGTLVGPLCSSLLPDVLAASSAPCCPSGFWLPLGCLVFGHLADGCASSFGLFFSLFPLVSGVFWMGYVCCLDGFPGYCWPPLGLFGPAVFFSSLVRWGGGFGPCSFWCFLLLCPPLVPGAVFRSLWICGFVAAAASAWPSACGCLWPLVHTCWLLFLVNLLVSFCCVLLEVAWLLSCCGHDRPFGLSGSFVG